jgi:hypothetical protein
MSTRTIIEINHDYLRELTALEPSAMLDFIFALRGTLKDAERIAPPGVRVLGQRHHSETLKLEVR